MSMAKHAKWHKSQQLKFKNNKKMRAGKITTDIVQYDENTLITIANNELPRSQQSIPFASQRKANNQKSLDIYKFDIAKNSWSLHCSTLITYHIYDPQIICINKIIYMAWGIASYGHRENQKYVLLKITLQEWGCMIIPILVVPNAQYASYIRMFNINNKLVFLLNHTDDEKVVKYETFAVSQHEYRNETENHDEHNLITHPNGIIKIHNYFSSGTCAVNETIYVFGGYKNHQSSDDFRKISLMNYIKTDSQLWIPKPLSHLKCAVSNCKDIIILFSGSTYNTFERKSGSELNDNIFLYNITEQRFDNINLEIPKHGPNFEGWSGTIMDLSLIKKYILTFGFCRTICNEYNQSIIPSCLICNVVQNITFDVFWIYQSRSGQLFSCLVDDISNDVV